MTERIAHPGPEDSRRFAHRIHPLACEQDEHGRHSWPDVIEVVVRLLEELALANAGGARLANAGGARR